MNHREFCPTQWGRAECWCEWDVKTPWELRLLAEHYPKRSQSGKVPPRGGYQVWIDNRLDDEEIRRCVEARKHWAVHLSRRTRWEPYCQLRLGIQATTFRSRMARRGISIRDIDRKAHREHQGVSGDAAATP